MFLYYNILYIIKGFKMKKRDEIDFFWYLIESEVSEYSGCVHPGRDKI